MNDSIFSGTDYLKQGFTLLKHPAIRPFVVIPLLINIVVYSLIIWYAAGQFSIALDWLMGWLPDWQWLAVLSWILWPLFVLSLLIIIAYTFTIVANLIASPFNGLLSERVEKLKGGEPATADEGMMAVLASIPRSIRREIAKLAHYLPRALLVLIVSFIPGINTIAPILWFILGAWMMTVEYCDFPMDNHKLNFKQSLTRLRQNRTTSMGFGGTTLLLTMVPLLNLLVIPAAVCGGTLYWMDKLKHAEQPKG